MAARRPAIERFHDKVEATSDLLGCVMWRGGLNSQGYGSFYFNGGSVGAHRFAYEYFVEPVPEGLHLDHLCRNRACVNPMHLEAVSCAVNLQRGAKGDLLTHCVKGHEYTPENTIIRRNGGRTCRECSRTFSRRYRDRNLDQVRARDREKTARRRAERAQLEADATLGRIYRRAHKLEAEHGSYGFPSVHLRDAHIEARALIAVQDGTVDAQVDVGPPVGAVA